jgi:hypothetical protein
VNDLRNKLDRLFNNSLTEFVLIFTFVILVITFSFKAQRDEAIKQAGLTEQELVELANIGKNISELEKKLGLEVSDQLGLSARISAIKKSIPKNFDINEDWEHLKLIKSQLGGDIDKVLSLATKIDTLQKQNKMLAKRAGLDYQPCEVTSEGKLIYLAQVTLFEDTFYFEPLSTNSLHSDNENIKLHFNYINSSEFEALARSYYEWSDKTENQCRFFVKVIDATSQKVNYKRSLSMVERYFYKYEVKI